MLVLGVLMWLPAERASAGGGPENVLVVVNPLSVESLTIANHFCHLRQIHAVNVVHLPWRGSRETIDVQTFRSAILEPIFTEIGRRKLDRQIDYIVYSSGFPYAVDFSADPRVPLPADPQQRQAAGTVGSLTGLTFLHARVRSHDTSYVFTQEQPRSNFYESTATRGFRSVYRWNRQGQRVAVGGESYYLSMMLGYTDGRGNTVEEVVRYLERSALADCTQPRGTVYFMTQRPDEKVVEPRTATRMGAFPQVKVALTQQGIKAEIEPGVAPYKKMDVVGAVLGRSVVDWPRYGSTILPGAICDNLTSYGGILKQGATQTPLTDFLRLGAAGSSGTVVEPFSLQAKFPHPWIHVHYAGGATLAEAFYQSVEAPYQLLIVGDPLCRPWARAPLVQVDGLQPGQTVKGKVALTPKSPPKTAIKLYQLFVDGLYRAAIRPGQSVELDTTELPDGHHEVRLVAVEDSVVESQGRLILPVRVDNRGNLIGWKLEPETITHHQDKTISTPN